MLVHFCVLRLELARQLWWMLWLRKERGRRSKYLLWIPSATYSSKTMWLCVTWLSKCSLTLRFSFYLTKEKLPVEYASSPSSSYSRLSYLRFTTWLLRSSKKNYILRKCLLYFQFSGKLLLLLPSLVLQCGKSTLCSYKVWYPKVWLRLFLTSIRILSKKKFLSFAWICKLK